jgi:hypothetical protein
VTWEYKRGQVEKGIYPRRSGGEGKSFRASYSVDSAARDTDDGEIYDMSIGICILSKENNHSKFKMYIAIIMAIDLWAIARVKACTLSFLADVARSQTILVLLTATAAVRVTRDVDADACRPWRQHTYKLNTCQRISHSVEVDTNRVGYPIA